MKKTEVKEGLTYKDSGVNYDLMDPFKKECQMAAIKTYRNAERLGFTEIGWSRGESAYLLNGPAGVYSQVEEGLGTKNLVADAMHLMGRNLFHHVSQDTIAMIVNDCITVGTMSIALAMHLAVGDGGWFKDEERYKALIAGWKNACDLSRCIWGPGETPTLKDIISPETFSLSGSCMGYALNINIPFVEDGYTIIMFESSGIHANGLTLARKIERLLPDGYGEKLHDGTVTSYGEALLKPTHIYVGAIEDLQKAKIDIGYMVNITGHGWRKLMRLNGDFEYVIEDAGNVPSILSFMQKHGNVSDREAYGNLNMGAGFAIYVRPDQTDDVLSIVNGGDYGFKAWRAGYIKKGPKKVVIKEKDLIFEGKELEIR